MRLFGSWWLMGLVLCLPGVTMADPALASRKEVQQFIHTMVNQYHFDRWQLNAVMKEAQFQPQIIASMDKPYEKKTWDVYQALFLTPDRVQAGLSFWQANQQALARAEREYGVPAPMIVAIIGVETLYGKHQGNYRVLDALTTLAFDYPKRSPFFTKELAEYLLLCREQGVPVTQYLGSYAGAIGKPQFMPSSYRFYAVDFTGKGARDLVNDDSDAIGSVANFFHRHGWIKNGSIAEPALIRGTRYKTLAVNSRKPDYRLPQLMSFGVKPASRQNRSATRAGLIELTTPKGAEYWVAYPNFYVITHYNTSPQYALVVYLFAEQLKQQWAAGHA